MQFANQKRNYFKQMQTFMQLYKYINGNSHTNPFKVTNWILFT